LAIDTLTLITTELGNADGLIHDANGELAAVGVSCPAHPVLRRAHLLALAQGFYGPCGEAFGADQFTPSDDANPSAPAFRSSYFNWFHFSISWGYAIASAGLSYVQDNAGWTLGFGACWTAMLLCLAVFLLGTRTYRAKQPADGGTFAVTVRAWAARVFRRKDATPTER
jgi:solute carrier family 15 (peptide/histidine transporter), member 3/4